MKQGTGWKDVKAKDGWLTTAAHIKTASIYLAKGMALLNDMVMNTTAGRKVSVAERKMQSDMNKYLAPGAGSDPKAIHQLTAIAVRMLGALMSNRSVNFVPTLYNTAEGWPGFIQIGPGFFLPQLSASDRVQIIGHEIFHSTHPGNRDTIIQPARGGQIGGYGRANAERRAKLTSEPLANNLRNPDAITFALGFPGGRA
jgi:hypothetical protein